MAPAPTLLVVDDEDLIRWSLHQRFQGAGYRVLDAASGAEARRLMNDDVDLVLLDNRLPDAEGLDLLGELHHDHPDSLVVLMTAYSSIESAVDAIKAGAYHYVNKPFRMDDMVVLVEKALETTRLRREVRALRERQSRPYSLERIIGVSPAMVEAKALIRKVAQSPCSTVLLTGESGTGKDIAAKAIHYQSSRADGPFLTITCSALPETLLESELFGHERGSFTDARQRKRGLLEIGSHGSVFLDEIGETTPALQAKLLRFLEEKTFKRVGGTADIKVDVRVIAATNRNLTGEVESGRFRDDLFYRLSVLPITLPPLRERVGDIPILVGYFLDGFNREFKKQIRAVSPKAMELMESYAWQGNVRELKNAVERAVLLCEGDVLEPRDFLTLFGRTTSAARFKLPPSGIDFETVERDFLMQALERTHGNRTRAAALLGMNRDQIRYRISKFHLEG